LSILEKNANPWYQCRYYKQPGNSDKTANGDGHNTPDCGGDSLAISDSYSPATTDSDSTANSEGDCVSVRNEGSHTATCSTGDQHGFSADADYTLHEREAHCSMLAVELGLKSTEEKQEEAENKVSVEDENAQTLSLQASELKEMESSGTEAQPLTASAEQEQVELGEPKTEKQMKKLEKENRRLRRIPKNLTEE
jgi:hypothetical protein